MFSLVYFLCTWVRFYALNNISITYIEKNSCVGMLILFSFSGRCCSSFSIFPAQCFLLPSLFFLMNYLVAMLCAESISKTPSLILVLSLWPYWQTEKKLMSLNDCSHLFLFSFSFFFFFFSGVGWGFKGFILFIYFLLLNVS